MERIITANAGDDEEERVLTTLRPRSLADFIGQDLQRQRLDIAFQAARQRREPLDHLLLSGPPGLPAMEDFKVDFVLDKGPYARAIPLVVKPFTLVGATTRKGLLPPPLRDRFGLNFELDFYTDADLTLIVRRSAGLLNVRMQVEAAEEVARRSRGTPRIANRLLRRVRDYAQVHGVDDVGAAVVNKALELEGVDELGLDDLDRRYLRTLVVQYEGRPTGVTALAASMQQEVDTLEEVVEPFLLHQGFLLRTPNGRLASAKAYSHLRIQRPRRNRAPQQPLLLDSDSLSS